MEAWRLIPAQDLGLSLGARLKSVRRECGWIERAIHVLGGWFARGYMETCHRLRLLGVENLPVRPPFVLVSNHASHLDTLALLSAVPWPLRGQVFPLAAGDLFFERSAMAAFAAWVMNALPVWRRPCGRTDIESLRRRLLEEPCGYILFPEGTRTRTGQMRPFRKGIGKLVAGTEVPVIPCFLRGTFKAAPPSCVFPRFQKITLEVGRPLSFPAVENTFHGWKQISGLVERAVREIGACRAGPRADPGAKGRPAGS